MKSAHGLSANFDQFSAGVCYHGRVLNNPRSSTVRPPLQATPFVALLLACQLAGTAVAQEDEWEDDEAWEEDRKDAPDSDETTKKTKAPEQKTSTKRKTKAKPGPTKTASKKGVNIDGADAADLPIRLGASLGFFVESGAIRDDDRRDAANTNRDQEYDADLDPSVMLQLWFPLSRTFQVSTGLRYGGSYDVSTGEDDDDVYVFGQQLEAHIGMEAWIDVFSGLDVVLGLRGGFGAIFPTDDLDTEIDRVQGQGADAWSTPRLGLLLTPVAGARWELGDVVAIRGELAVSFGRYFLFNYSGTINAGSASVYYERSAVANFTRYEFSAGIEFALDNL